MQQVPKLASSGGGGNIRFADRLQHMQTCSGAWALSYPDGLSCRVQS